MQEHLVTSQQRHNKHKRQKNCDNAVMRLNVNLKPGIVCYLGLLPVQGKLLEPIVQEPFVIIAKWVVLLIMSLQVQKKTSFAACISQVNVLKPWYMACDSTLVAVNEAVRCNGNLDAHLSWDQICTINLQILIWNIWRKINTWSCRR